MAYELNFGINVSGLSDVQKIEAIVAAIGKSANLTAAQLNLFEQVLKADVTAGNSLVKSLQDLSASSSSVGKEISGAAAAALKATEAQSALNAATQKTASTAQGAQESISGLNKEMQNATKGFALGALGLGAFGGIGLQVGRGLADGLVGTIKELTTGFAESSRETERFAERMGLTNSKARELENIAALAGVNVGTLSAASRILANALEDSNGSGKKAAAALNELGIATRTLNGGTREEGEVLTELIEKLSKIPDPTERARLAFVTLGRGAKEILPLIDELDELKGRLNDLGISYTDDIIKTGAEADKSFRELALSFKYLKDTLASKIAPILIPFLVTFAKGVSNVTNGTEYNPHVGSGGGLGVENRTNGQGLSQDDLNAALRRLTDQTQTQLGIPTADASGAKAAQEKQANTADGLQGRIKDLQSKLTAAQGIMTDPSVDSRAHADATRAAADAEKEINSLQSRIDAIKATGKAAEDAEKLVDRFNAAMGRIAGKGQSEFARLESEVRGNLADLSAGGQLTPERQQKAEDSLSDAFTTNVGNQLNVTLKKALKGTYFDPDESKSGMGAVFNAKPNQQKIDNLIDQAQTNSDHFATKDYAEQEKQRRERLNEIGPNAMQIGGSTLDLSASLPLQRTRQQVGTTYDQDAQSQERMIGITEGGGKDPLAIQMQIAAIEKQVADQHYADAKAEASSIANLGQRREALFAAQVTHEDQLHALQLKNAEDIATYQKQQQEEFAHTFSTGLQALISGKGGAFFTDIGKKLEDTIFTNAGRMIAGSDQFKAAASSLHIGGKDSFLGNLLTGTPFGPDPTKDVAITANTTALTLLTTAMGDTYAALTGNSIAGIPTDPSAVNPSGGILGSGTGLFGGGALGNGVYSLAGSGTIGSAGTPDIAALASQTGAPAMAGIMAAMGLAGGSGTIGASGGGFGGGLQSLIKSGRSLSSIGGLFSGSGQDYDNSGFTDAQGNNIPDIGLTDASSDSDSDTGGGGGIGLGSAVAAGGGILAAVNGFSKGGARGDLQGVGGVLTTAAALDPEPISKAILGIGAMFTGLIGGLLGDPRQARANQINKELGNAKYEAPVAINETVDTSGNYQDYNQFGGVRTSPFRGTPMVSQPYQWYHNGSFISYPGQTISPFQNPDLVIPPSVAPNSPYNPEGVSKGGSQVVAPGTGVQPATTTIIQVQAMDSDSFGQFLSKTANQQHLANNMTSIVTRGMGSQFRDTFSRSVGIR